MVESVLYTGKHRKSIKSMKFSEVIEPSSEQMVILEMKFDEYYKKLMDQSAFNISCM